MKNTGKIRASVFAIIASYFFVFSAHSMDDKESEIRRPLLSSDKTEQKSYSHETIEPNPPGYSGGSYNLERSPNRFVYSQMVSYPSSDLTDAFELADEQYRISPQARDLSLVSFKWIADAGHPLAKERYADLVVAITVDQSRNVGRNRSRYRGLTGLIVNPAVNSSRAADAYTNVAHNYDIARQYYKSALSGYRPNSVYVQQLTQKMSLVSGRKTQNDKAAEEECCVLL